MRNHICDYCEKITEQEQLEAEEYQCWECNRILDIEGIQIEGRQREKEVMKEKYGL